MLLGLRQSGRGHFRESCPVLFQVRGRRQSRYGSFQNLEVLFGVHYKGPVLGVLAKVLFTTSTIGYWSPF